MSLNYSKFKKSKTPKTYTDSQMARRAKNLCIQCGEAPVPSKRFCRICLDKASARYHTKFAGVPPIEKCKARWKQIGRNKELTGNIWTITPDDLLWPTNCPVLGWELDYTGKDRERSWSIDQLVPQGGYVPGNVTIISRLANQIKTNASADQIQKVADWLRTQESGLQNSPAKEPQNAAR